uniref:Uncharacterized protein n=1 Tax=Ditylenchus dipsaci TaxID=166011 RepID=A0A915ECJ0_9BILA
MEKEKQEEEEKQQFEVEPAEEEGKMDMSENSRWSMAFHGDSPSICTISVQAAEKRKQLLDLMTSTRQNRSRSSSILSQSFKSPTPQTNAWPQATTQRSHTPITPKQKHQPAVPSPLVMSELTYVLHKEREQSPLVNFREQSYGFNSAAKKTPQHKIFGESLMLSPGPALEPPQPTK